MDLSNAWEQLLLLRDQTRRTDALHEAQVLQLKCWPRVLFDTSTASQFAIDFAKKRIVFTVTTSRKKRPKGDIEFRLGPKRAAEALNEYTKLLLGSDWDVDIKVGAGTSMRCFEFPGEARGE